MTKLNRKHLFATAILLGAASVGIQIVLIRQFLTIFYGNELIVGFLLAVWLACVGLGSAVGTQRWQKHVPSFHLIAPILLSSLSLALGAAIISRFARLILAMPLGEQIPLAKLSLLALLLLLCPCFLLGILFSLLSALQRMSQADDVPAAQIYIYEAGGTCLLGIIFSFIAPHLSNLFLLYGLLIASAWLLFICFRQKWLLILAAAATILLAPLHIGKLESHLVRSYWDSFHAGFQVIRWENTRFGEIALLDVQGDSYLYKNGAKVTLLNDELTNQPLAALLVTAHPRPRRILLIEGALGGLPAELARFDSLQITALEIDAAAFNFVQSRYPRDHINPSNQSSIAVIHQDARYFLQHDDSQFDMIVINAGDPVTAGAARYYTKEFFRQCRNHLDDKGLLALTHLTAGENFIGDELVTVHKMLLNTLESEFDHVLALPGDQAIYLAATAKSSLTTQIEPLKHRYNQYRTQLPAFHPSMFITLYDSMRIASFREQLQQSTIDRINTDFRPIAYIFDFLLWYKRDRGDLKILPFYLSALTVRVFAGMLILMVILAGILRWIRISGKFRILTAASAVGFAAMVFQFVLLLALQMLYGYIYSWLAAAMAAFMAGMSLVSGIVARRMSSWRTPRALQGYILCAILFSLMLLPLATLVSDRLYLPGFIVLIFGAGGVSGGCFPLLCRRYQEITNTSDFGGVYAADLIGGAGAALLLCTLLIPIIGMQHTLFAAAAVLLSGLVLIWEGERPH